MELQIAINTALVHTMHIKTILDSVAYIQSPHASHAVTAAAGDQTILPTTN